MSIQPSQRPAATSNILLVAIIACFVFAHGIASQKMAALNGIDRSASDPNVLNGEPSNAHPALRAPLPLIGEGNVREGEDYGSRN